MSSEPHRLHLLPSLADSWLSLAIQKRTRGGMSRVRYASHHPPWNLQLCCVIVVSKDHRPQRAHQPSPTLKILQKFCTFGLQKNFIIFLSSVVLLNNEGESEVVNMRLIDIDVRDILKKLEETLRLKREVPLPPFGDNELREKIRNKIEDDLSPDLYGNVAYDLLYNRHEEVPELVENLAFAYLVKVEYSGGLSIFSGDTELDTKIWSTYFKRIYDPVEMMRYMISLIRSSGTEISPDDIEVIEILPNIPTFLWEPYKEGKLTLEEVLEKLEELPEV